MCRRPKMPLHIEFDPIVLFAAQFCNVCPTVYSTELTVYSKLLHSVASFLNCLKPVNHGPFGQSKMQITLDFCPDQPGRNWIAAKVLLSNMYSVVCTLHNSNKDLTLGSISCIGLRYFVLRAYPKCLPYQIRGIKPKQKLQTLQTHQVAQIASKKTKQRLQTLQTHQVAQIASKNLLQSKKWKARQSLKACLQTQPVGPIAWKGNLQS